MDAKSFRRLCAALADLTGPQLKELRAALRSLNARMQAIGAIERRREGAVACPHCGHGSSTRWGSTRTGVQRLRWSAPDLLPNVGPRGWASPGASRSGRAMGH